MLHSDTIYKMTRNKSVFLFWNNDCLTIRPSHSLILILTHSLMIFNFKTFVVKLSVSQLVNIIFDTVYMLTFIYPIWTFTNFDKDNMWYTKQERAPVLIFDSLDAHVVSFYNLSFCRNGPDYDHSCLDAGTLAFICLSLIFQWWVS